MYIRVFLNFQFQNIFGLTLDMGVYAYKNELQKLVGQSNEINPSRIAFEINESN